MKYKDKAQTATEYLAVIAVLAIALAVGWGFITGGFQGSVKNLSQSVDIASNDPLRKGGGAPQLPFCNCDDDLNNWNCGEEPTIPIPATINCNPRQRYKRKLCSGTLCSQAQIEWCEWDDNCCEIPIPDPAGGANHCWNNYCPQPTQVAQGWGAGRMLKRCGNNPAYHECDGQTICQFTCGWNTVTSTQVNPQPQNSTYCPDGAVDDNTDVPQNSMSHVLRSSQAGCTSARKCETYCNTPYQYVSNPTPRCIICRDTSLRSNFIFYGGRSSGNRWAEATLPANTLTWKCGGGGGELPCATVFDKNNIGRIEFEVITITHYGHAPAPIGNCSGLYPIQTTLNSTAGSYQLCHVNFRTSVGVGRFSLPFPHADYVNQTFMSGPTRYCDPDRHLWKPPPRGPNQYPPYLLINNHSETFVAEALWDISNTLTGLRLMSCSPDNDGSVSFDEALISAKIVLQGC